VSTKPTGEGDTGSYAVATLTIAWVLAFVDRQILILLVPSLKASLQLSDSQVSLLHGFAFSLCFALAGLPIGRLVDRANRRNILIVGALGWSLATMACGLAHSFTAIFAARMIVGISQACLAPASMSIVADCIASERRGRAVGFLLGGANVGAAVALLGGGAALGLLAGTSRVLPLVGPLENWQLVFWLASAPNVVLVFLLLALREPPRHRIVSAQPGDGQFVFARYLKENVFVFSALFGLMACNLIVGYGASTWLPVLFMRNLGMAPASVGFLLGIITLVLGPLAAVAGGAVGDRFVRMDPQSGRLRAMRSACPLAGLAFLPLLMGHTFAALILTQVLFTLIASVISTLGYALLPELVPDQGRGQVIAVLSFIGNLVGLGLGPTLIALITDHVLGNEGLVHYSILIVALPAYIAATVLATLVMARARSLRAAVLAASAGTELASA
jgi:MFS family permease